jgi:hypothetical protein
MISGNADDIRGAPSFAMEFNHEAGVSQVLAT